MTNKDREAFEQQCPEKIYLLDMGEDMPVWCDDASPDYDDRFSVEYIRADVALAESAKEIAEKDAEIKRIADAIHWPDCWDTAAYPTLLSAIQEIGCNPEDCTKLATTKKEG